MLSTIQFFFNFVLILAICPWTIETVHLEIEEQLEHDKVPTGQRLSPSVNRRVSDMKMKLAEWVENRNVARNSGKQKYSFSFDQSEGSSSSTFDQPQPKAINGDQQTDWQQHLRSAGNNFLGSIYFQQPQIARTLSDASDVHSRSPHSDVAFDHYSGSRSSNASGQYSPNRYDQSIPNEIVEFDHYAVDNHTNRSDQQGTLANVDRNLIDVTTDQRKHKSRELTKNMSDFSLQKCGKMPKLLKKPKLSEKLFNLKLDIKLDLLHWKQCIKESLPSHSNRSKLLTNYLTQNNAQQANNDGSEKLSLKGQQLFLRDTPEWNNNGNSGGQKWGQNPFDCKTPSFRYNNMK